ncbi:hypothetical protein MHN00_13925 [Alteromonas sp. Cnat2-8]|uniref:hypothetical protein n=1 Tax=Alteromonas sp. Cnat2-8 TaxID=2917728 RepID=UPI001EF5EDA3|nr:hypothetical protein [Alteromonas sp. Cnat2-8]MCG7654652.1 hypothetical protein [Alteromonas sp. Cnat2-8]
MNRLFDTNLLNDAGWTEGEEWVDCNPAQDFNEVYHRIYGASEEDDIPNYRIDPGDNFYIGANKNVIRDWTPVKSPWKLNLDGKEGGLYTLYFGVQKGVADIDTTLENHAPYIIKHQNTLFEISADYHRILGLKIKDSATAIKLTGEAEGITIQNAVLINTPLIDTGGYRMLGWVLRTITFIGVVAKMLNIPLASSNVSLQDIHATGEGDCGLKVEEGHSNVEVIALTIDNEYHQFDEVKVLYHGVVFASGGTATVRYNTINGFSGNAFIFNCVANVKGLVSDKCGAGIYFGEEAKARDCMITFLRQIQGDSYAYFFAKNGELNNCGCNLDETGGLGVVVLSEGSTVAVNGGDYQLKLPLPFVTALGNSTIVLNNVTVNGVLYNETIEMAKGESWRGEKASVVLDSMPVYANKTLYQPYNHIPQMANAVSVQGSERPFDEVITLPSGAKLACTRSGSVRYNPAETWLHLDPGETAIDYFRYSTETEIYTHQFEINASPEVGAKVVQPDSFTGSGWSKDGERYSANNISTSLNANYNFEQGEIYQISLKLEGRTSGGVLPSIGSAQGQYSHYLEGTEVWLIRAPANASSISILGQSYSGKVLNIYVRKLLRAETPAVPLLEFSQSGNEINLEWYIEPVKRLKDEAASRVYITGELAESVRNGYFDNDRGNYLFENVYSNGRKTAINLRGGGNLDVYRLEVTGGYTGEFEKWQNAISPEMNDGPYFEKIQACYVKADLYLNSSNGVYTSQFGNSDILVFNGLTNPETFEAEAYVLGMNGRNASDGIIDTKKRTEVNHSTFYGAYRSLRVHNVGTSLVANCDFTRLDGTKECIAPTHSYCFVELWNTHADGIRCVTTDQMKSQVNAGHNRFSDVGVIRLEAGSVSVLKTYPTIKDYCRVAMTDMEFEVSSNNGVSWSPLAVPDVGLPGVIGCFERSLSFSSGTYKVRCRCLNGALVGNWSNEITITV